MINTLTDQLQAIGNGAIEALPSIVIAGIVVLFTAVVARSARGIANRLVGASELRPSLQNLVVTLVRLGVWLSGLMIAALVVFPNFSPSSLIAGLGIGAVAIGFAFQDFFENFISGVMIMLRDTMQIGDVIKTGEIHGKVEFISLRESHIRAFSGELHVLPNSQLFKNPVEVITDKPKRRFEVVIGVSYDTDLDEADKAIREAVEGVDLIDKDERVDVLADTFNSSSVDFIVRWWAPSSGKEAVLNRDQVVRAIKRGLDEAGIEIPFPYVTHTFKEQVPVGEKVGETV